jgi:four helix bundle protein
LGIEDWGKDVENVPHRSREPQLKYSDLRVWQEAMDLVVEFHRSAKSFPHEERFGLASQMQRAAVSIPSNIAEGQGRKATNAYTNHLSIAFGSLMELETQIRIAFRLNYIPEAEASDLLVRTDNIGKMLGALIKSLKK